MGRVERRSFQLVQVRREEGGREGGSVFHEEGCAGLVFAFSEEDETSRVWVGAGYDWSISIRPMFRPTWST